MISRGVCWFVGSASAKGYNRAGHSRAPFVGLLYGRGPAAIDCAKIQRANVSQGVRRRRGRFWSTKRARPPIHNYATFIIIYNSSVILYRYKLHIRLYNCPLKQIKRYDIIRYYNV